VAFILPCLLCHLDTPCTFWCQ